MTFGDPAYAQSLIVEILLIAGPSCRASSSIITPRRSDLSERLSAYISLPSLSGILAIPAWRPSVGSQSSCGSLTPHGYKMHSTTMGPVLSCPFSSYTCAEQSTGCLIDLAPLFPLPRIGLLHLSLSCASQTPAFTTDHLIFWPGHVFAVI